MKVAGGVRWSASFVALIVLASVAAGAEIPVSADVEVKTVEAQAAALGKASLEATAEKWLAGLEEAGIALAAAPDDAEQKATRDKLAARFEVIVDALEGMEVDVAAYRAYLAKIRGGKPATELDIEQAGKFVTAIKDWVVSPEGGIKWAKAIALFIVTIIAFRILAGILGGITRRAVGRMKKTSELLRDFFVNTVRKLTNFIGIIIALSFVGVNIGPFLAAIGAVGFIIGFALQGTLSNFASGIMILLYRPYDIGDFVSVAGTLGKVDAMTLVSTTLKTPDNQQVIIPNNSIWGDVITNVTGNPTRRVDMVFGIGYSDDIAKAKAILERILEGHEKILKDPAPVVQVHELADSSVNFVVRPWSKTGDYWDVYWDVTRAVKEQFDAEGVSIPFPQQDVHMHTVTAE
jgi:small conductance mechanosensitive channel